MDCQGLVMLLVKLVARGLVPLEALDEPSPEWQDNARTAGPWAVQREHRNLAREWIAANPEPWAALLEQYRQEREERGQQRVGMTSWLEDALP
jgi:hypothetical protein